jgi:hypothetical protein
MEETPLPHHPLKGGGGVGGGVEEKQNKKRASLNRSWTGVVQLLPDNMHGAMLLKIRPCCWQWQSWSTLVHVVVAIALVSQGS